MEEIAIKTPNPKCGLYWCLIGFIDLKGPKLEIFGSRVFPQISPVCVGDL